ncbi:MAG: SGNH/GDSL hydrolase family protein [bacterium]|nr:SGNH/GDSL hydrolase family protein [bacterium]
MHRKSHHGLLALLLVTATSAPAAQEPAATFWHGYRQLDFALANKRCRLVVPEHVAPGRPWVWRARFPDYHPEPDRILLARGFHVAHIDTGGMLGGEKAMALWDAFYRTLREEHELAARPALEAVSRGGLFAYHWAARHPERVACIYADTPVCDITSWPLGRGTGIGHEATWQHLLRELELTHEEALRYARNPIDLLEPLAKASIPLLTVVSLNDRVVPPTENTFVLAERYRALGGDVRLIEVAEGTAKSNGHHFPHPDPLRAADFIERHAAVSPSPDGYHARRDPLANCRIRFEEQRRGRVAFLGGSITFNPGWRDAVCAYLKERFPNTELDFVAAGNPSMGSTPGAFRLEHDVFARGPVDLLVQEAAVNDSANGRGPLEMIRGTEGILRRARTLNPAIDVVVIHFVDPGKIASYGAGDVPEVIRLHESVAAHYQVSTVHLAREVAERLEAGQFTWKDDFRNLHPSAFGQRLYAASLRRLLSGFWDGPREPDSTIEAHALPPALDPFSYDAGELVGVEAATELDGFERIAACDPRAGGVGGGVRAGFVDVPMLVGTRPGARLALPFTGRAAGVWIAAGPDAGTIEYRIDEGSWSRRDLFTRWSGGLHLPWVHLLSVDQDGGEHRLEIRIAEAQNPRSKGHACRIVHFVVNGAPAR